MKILIIQLARFGDIFQSWPVANALKRQFPDCEVHVLVRKKFAAGLDGLSAVDRKWLLDLEAIFLPLIEESPDIQSSISKLENFCNELKEQKFDQIINLTFSPASSRFVDLCRSEATKLHGYSRTADDHLAIGDDGSAYFYAQVGVQKSNRVHITDLFAHVAEVDLNDNRALLESQNSAANKTLDENSTHTKDQFNLADRVFGGAILIHTTASDLAKTFTWSKWAQVVKGLVAGWNGEVILIGSAADVEIAERVRGVTGTRSAVNLCGQLKFSELLSLMTRSSILIGGDSAPIHLASIANLPTLNISMPCVRFWETGPKAEGSVVLKISDEAEISSDRVVSLAIAMARKIPFSPLVARDLTIYSKIPHRSQDPSAPVDWALVDGARPEAESEFRWSLIQALYMQGAFPPPPDASFVLGLERLSDANLLAIEQIQQISKNPQNAVAPEILNRTDEVIHQIARFVPDLGPLVGWFQTEKIRLGPGSVAELCMKSLLVHQRLAEVIDIYLCPSVAERDHGGPIEDSPVA
jgi:heptosyltransferase III